MTTSSTADARASLEIIELKRGLRFTLPILRMLLPTIETALFFSKVYELSAAEVGRLLQLLFKTDVVKALTSGSHSTELQGYVIDDLVPALPITKGQVTFKNVPPPGELLPELWASLEVEVAQSIKDVANKLKDTIGLMPGKKGAMVFKTMAKVNLRRPTLGDYRASIHHAPVKDNLVILDVSGSMTAETVRKIVADVVALSYTANAHLAIVSNTTTHWEPGAYNVDAILRAAEFGGTHYETLKPLFDRDWGVVVCIADYDSSRDAARALSKCKGRIDQVLDVSLVNQPTYLAECVGQLADEVRPLLIAPGHRVLAH